MEANIALANMRARFQFIERKKRNVAGGRRGT